jgi:hypothetical protein
VLLCDHTQRHVAIEVAPSGATEVELAAIAKATSDRLGVQMDVYVTLPVQDNPKALAQARRLLRLSDAQLAGVKGMHRIDTDAAQRE